MSQECECVDGVRGRNCQDYHPKHERPCRHYMDCSYCYRERDTLLSELTRLRGEVERLKNLHMANYGTEHGLPGHIVIGCHLCWEDRTDQIASLTSSLALAEKVVEAARPFAEMPMASETPGVARDDDFDELLGSVRMAISALDAERGRT